MGAKPQVLSLLPAAPVFPSGSDNTESEFVSPGHGMESHIPGSFQLLLHN